jgi:glycosyltransferase involved in cell wall biosynthesis
VAPDAASVSVVIPTFNSAGHVRETLEAALAQTHPRVQVCVSDHGSTDHTWDILGEYGDRISRQRITPGGGAGRNWDAATSMATGEYLKLLCADDLITPDCVAVQVAALEAEPRAALVSAKRDLVDARGEVLVRGRGLGPLVGHHEGPAAVRALVRAGVNLLGEPGTVLMRRAALLAAGGWCDTYPYLIDQHTYMRVLAEHDMVGLDRVLASFRVTGGQWSVRLAREQARQVREVHAVSARESPGTVRGRDVRLGNARARAAALARRAAYLAWRRRM